MTIGIDSYEKIDTKLKIDTITRQETISYEAIHKINDIEVSHDFMLKNNIMSYGHDINDRYWTVYFKIDGNRSSKRFDDDGFANFLEQCAK